MSHLEFIHLMNWGDELANSKPCGAMNFKI